MPIHHSVTDMYEHAVSVAGSVFTLACYNAEGRYDDKIAKELTELASGFHPVLIFYGTNLKQYAKKIVGGASSAKLLDLSSRFGLGVFNNQQEWQQFCDHLAFQLSLSNDLSSYLPQATREVLPTNEEISNQLRGNPWFAFLVVLRLSDAHLVAIRQANRGKVAAAPKGGTMSG